MFGFIIVPIVLFLLWIAAVSFEVTENNMVLRVQWFAMSIALVFMVLAISLRVVEWPQRGCRRMTSVITAASALFALIAFMTGVLNGFPNAGFALVLALVIPFIGFAALLVVNQGREIFYMFSVPTAIAVGMTMILSLIP